MAILSNKSCRRSRRVIRIRNLFPLTIAFLCPILLSGCYETFQPETEGKPVLCLNSLITAGSPIEVSVTHTWVYDKGDGKDNHSVEDAVVRIYANGMIVDEDYTAAEGDLICIEASSKAYGDARAEVRVPEAPSVESFSLEPAFRNVYEIKGYNRSEIKLITVEFNLKSEIKIHDSKDSEDYYRLLIDYYKPELNEGKSKTPDSTWKTFFNLGQLEYNAEPIFSEHIGIFESVMGSDDNGYLFFTDRKFQGSSYTLHLQFDKNSYSVEYLEWDPDLADCGLTITLNSISESYYKWINYLWQMNDGPLGDYSELGFAEPMWGYSNVSTGAGVVAAQASSRISLPLRDFILAYLKSHAAGNQTSGETDGGDETERSAGVAAPGGITERI